MSGQRSGEEGRGAGGDTEWLTLGQAAKYLGVAQSTMRKWSDQNRVKAFYTPGGHRRFRLPDLQAFVEHSGPPGGGPDGPLVLVVDDDARLREFLRVNLELEGYSVREAESGPQALEAIDDQAPDLILLDVVMPGIDGWQMLQEMQERHGTIPVVMFSGQVDRRPAEEPDESRAREFVGKPFDPRDLLARARRLVPV